jgi:hypothetical protein
MAALALVGVVAATGISSVVHASRMADVHDAAAERFVVAERLMERSLALPFDEQASLAIAPGARELDGNRDMRATIRVLPAPRGLHRIEVEVRDRRGRTRLVALGAPWEDLR